MKLTNAISRSALCAAAMCALLGASPANAEGKPVYSYTIDGVRHYSATPPDKRATDVRVFYPSAAPPSRGWGLGNESCGKFNLDTAKYSPDDGLQWGGSQFTSPGYGYFQWIAGFLTGTELYGPIRTQSDLFGAYGWVAKYCAEHPEDRVINAAWLFLQAEAQR